MVTDADYRIVYVNPAVEALLGDAEGEIRNGLPQFRAGNLVGQNIDVFHKNPSHQRRLLGGLAAKHQATIAIGGRSFDLTVTPLRLGTGERAGLAVEWADASARLKNLEYSAQVAAISRAQAVIEFELDGIIRALGYSLPEIVGRHHSMFVDEAERNSDSYRQFWAARKSAA